MAEFTFPGGATGWVVVRRGVVAGYQKWTETHVSSSGGGGYIHQGSGTIRAPQVSSTVVERSEFWLKDSAGEIKLNLNVSVRDGHDVSVVYGNKSGETSGKYIMFTNHSINQMWFLDSGTEFESLYNKHELQPLKKKALLAFGLAAILSICILASGATMLLWVLIAAWCIYSIPIMKTMSQIRNTNRAALESKLINLSCSTGL